MSAEVDQGGAIPGVPSGPWSEDVETPGPVTDRVEEGDYGEDDGPEFEFMEYVPEAYRGPYFRELGKRKLQGRDAKTLVTAQDGQTGVGKTNLCDHLAHVTDTTPVGFSKVKITIEPVEFIEMYNHILPLKSALVMEEAEQFDSRRGMRNENVEGSQKWQQGRVREIMAFLNLPDPSMIDRRVERLADFWINVERRGFARIYEKKIHPTKRKVYYKTMQTFEWPNMDGSATLAAMDSLKSDLLDGETGADGLIRESEMERQIEQAKREERRRVRDELLTSIYRDTSLTAGDIAACTAVEIQGSRIRQIANGQG